MLVNEKGKVMAILGNQRQEYNNAAIGVKPKTGKEEQLFKMIYADEIPGSMFAKKGELNEDFGLLIGIPFTVQTTLPSGRYLDLVGRNMLIKTRNGLKSQEWFFDGRTKTIKSMRTKSYSWNIQSNGNTNNMEVYNTYSRWF